ncbi:MAG TPA: AraC family transcriptional regulator [Sporichthyaceae bacterium]|nr:AraC family transcriptional regulator [Sporichthyaceae bacterium]
MSSRDLAATVAALAPRIGVNRSEWARLVAYRFDAPHQPAFERVDSLAFCAVVSGRKSITVAGRTWHYDPMNYLVLTHRTDFDAQILQASPERPFLSVILQMDPALVRRVASDMAERTLTVLRRTPASAPDPDRPAFVSEFDEQTAGALLRFLQAVTTDVDRRVLAPLYLREIVYRLLQADQRDRLLAVAAEDATDPIAIAARYIRSNLARPLTVADIAEQVNMSASAFAHLFKEFTGSSPYQFLQQARLARARVLLTAGESTVGEVAKAVGYRSVSHFGSEFRRRFGVSPRAWAQNSPAGAAQG